MSLQNFDTKIKPSYKIPLKTAGFFFIKEQCH